LQFLLARIREIYPFKVLVLLSHWREVYVTEWRIVVIALGTVCLIGRDPHLRAILARGSPIHLQVLTRIPGNPDPK
jgi:hypothetical protein